MIAAKFPTISASQQAWAGPIDYTKTPDETLLVGTIFVIIFLTVQLAIAIYALIKYRRRRKETGQGWPTWAVLLTVFLIIVFWTVVFLNYVGGQGAQFIG